MCGIAGIFGNLGEMNSINKMVGEMKRRGPNDFGIWDSKASSIVLGQTRLSIIDLTDGGHQPMPSHNKRFQIVFNGEIYNYKELREQLAKKGAKFVSQSDTEVILWSWEIWGNEAPSHFRGMFAFAIWDELEQCLTLVRDRLGIKPLLWVETDTQFLFASNMKAILASGVVEPILNTESFFDFLSKGSVQQPGTIIDNVFSLYPGTIMTINSRFEITTTTFWEPVRDENLAISYSKMTYNELVGKTRFLLEEACRYHLIADVPVGSFLSGGVDSTAITALMARNSSRKIKSFSIGFESGKDLKSELTEAKIAAEYIGTEHTEVILTGEEIASSFEDFINILDQPSNDGINTYWVSKIAHPDVKVALSGLGGDEIFCGYNHFAWPSIYKNANQSFPEKLLSKLFNFAPWYGRAKTAYLKVSTPSARLAILRTAMMDQEILNALNSTIGAKFKMDRILNYIQSHGFGIENSIYDITRYECSGYLLNTLLRDADAVSMGNSIEVRPPLLDHFLVEHALSLPDDCKWRNGIGKSVLKDAASDLLPPDFFKRQKTGFTLPTNRWLNTNLKERYFDVINSDITQRYFNKSFQNFLLNNVSNPHKNRYAYLVFVFLEWAAINKIQVANGKY